MTQELKQLIDKLGSLTETHEAMKQLQEIGPEAVEALIEALEQQGDTRKGIFSAIVLGNIGDRRAVDPLIRTLKRSREWEVRRRAAWALGKIGDPAAVPALKVALTNDPNPDVRGFAAGALGAIRDSKATQVLIQALGDLEITDDYSPVCYQAIGALGKIGGTEARDALIEVLRAGIPSSLINPTLSLISAIMGEREPIRYDHSARLIAVQALGEIRDDASIQALREVVQSEHQGGVSEIVRRAAKEALQQTRHKS